MVTPKQEVIESETSKTADELLDVAVAEHNRKTPDMQLAAMASMVEQMKSVAKAVANLEQR
eukprot:11238587-Alexandrium_andersonii.AAC.1